MFGGFFRGGFRAFGRGARAFSSSSHTPLSSPKKQLTAKALVFAAVGATGVGVALYANYYEPGSLQSALPWLPLFPRVEAESGLGTQGGSKAPKQEAEDAQGEFLVTRPRRMHIEDEDQPFRTHKRSPRKEHHTGANVHVYPEKFKDMRVFSGRANVPLAREITKALGIPLGKVSIRMDEGGELGIQVNENVRGKDVYIIQPTSPPAINDHLMELILLVSTMRRASARSIVAVIPYYAYARSDRKMQSRVPIAAADVARVLESVGVDRVLAVDLHGGQIQGFFSPQVPCDNLESHMVALPFIQKLSLDLNNTVVVSPDAGGVNRAKVFRDLLKNNGIDAGLAMVIKQKSRASDRAIPEVVGNVEGSDVILVDDMIDTAKTLTRAATALKERGAHRILAFATHGLFNGDAIDRVRASPIEKVLVTNSLPIPAYKQIDKIEQLCIGPMLAEAIERIHTNQSVSSLFKKESSALVETHTHPAPHHKHTTPHNPHHAHPGGHH